MMKIQGEKMLKYCKCGCNQEVKEGNIFINGHNRLKLPVKKLILNENFAYILSTIIGDGSIEWDIKEGNYIVKLEVKDKDFALAFKKALEEWTGFKLGRKKDKDKGVDFVYFYRGAYQVRLCSKIVVDYLKGYNLNKIKIASKKIKKMFLRGFYDSEGCVDIDMKEIKISNNNKQLLQFCKDLLLDLGIESNKIGIVVRKGTPYKFSEKDSGITNFDNYNFNIYRKENFIKFRDFVGFSIKRKQDNLIKMINSYLTKKQKDFILSLSSNKRKNWKQLYNKENERHK